MTGSKLDQNPLARPRKGPLLKPHSRMYYARLILPSGKHVWRSLGTDSRSKAERLWPIVIEKLEIEHGVREGSLRQLREELVEAMRSGLAEEAGSSRPPLSWSARSKEPAAG